MDRPETNAQTLQEEEGWRLILIKKFILAGFAAGALSGCATYQGELQSSLHLLREGQPGQAAEKLKAKAEKEGDDQVVYLFEYGTALQLAKNYQESNQALLKAEDLTDIKDYHSLSRITGSLLLNEGMVQYKGEDYEKVFINALLAINYLSLGDLENAQVETRKLNDKLYKYKFESKREYEQNPFAFYLSAMIWETDRKWDDAYIDYKRAYELNPSVEYLKTDLPRLARLAHRFDDLDQWKKSFGTTKVPNFKGQGQIIAIIQQGWAPRKFPHPSWPRIPKLYPVPSQTQKARLVVEGVGEETSQVLSSVQDVAIKTLDDAYAPLIAKRMAGVVAKEVVADQIRQKNQLLGDLAWLGMHLADQADLRQWVTLPQSFQVARLPVAPGRYKVKLIGLDADGQPSGEETQESEIEVKAGAMAFVPWRTLK